MLFTALANAHKKVSVVIPALNEEATIAAVVKAASSSSLINEVIVVDPQSTDRTAELAAKAGATVVSTTQIRPDIAPQPGKGDAMWRGMQAATGDIIVFMDGDLVNPPAWWAPALANAVVEQNAGLVKGFYRRGHGADPDGGGRTTEILARPLLNILWPQLSHIIQPLGGEYAATKDFLLRVDFPPNYAIEVSLLIDAVESGYQVGQVNLGEKKHESQTTKALGRMGFQISQELLRRANVPAAAGRHTLVQFTGEEPQPYSTAHFQRLPAVLRRAPATADFPALSPLPAPASTML